MNLKDYLVPVKKNKFSSNCFDVGYLGNQLISSGKKKKIDADVQVALIGINATSNSIKPNHAFNADAVRQYLYQLSGFSNLKVTDLGNIVDAKRIADTYVAIKEITTYLVDKGIIPVFIGGSQEVSVYISEAIYERMQKIEVSFIDALIDFSDSKDFHSQSYLNHRFFQDSDTKIKSILGTQAYFSSEQKLKTIVEKDFNVYRLGIIRNNLQAIEPVLRDTHFCSFDMSSVRQCDAPAAVFKSPNGLYAEEACQIANISGLSDNLKAVFIGEIDKEEDASGQTSHLFAQILWHFLFGLSQRKGDYPVQSLENYKKIYVTNNKSGRELIFFQNKENNRFWVKLPGDDQEVIACSEQDYKSVCFNEIPERIWKRIGNTLK